MIEVQIDSNKKDQIHTFDIPIKLTRKQLEKMLSTVDGDEAPRVLQELSISLQSKRQLILLR